MNRFLAALVTGLVLMAPVAPATASVQAPPTQTQATVSAETVAQRNARQSAEDYLDMMAFSRKGLIRQLKYEGFTTAQATYGVDATRTNWKKQAARSAREYLDSMTFSRKGLIRQLKYEGFTTAQATYGVNRVGL